MIFRVGFSLKVYAFHDEFFVSDYKHMLSLLQK